MRRREFILLLGSAMMPWPVSAPAQHLMPIVGFLNSGSADIQRSVSSAYRRGLEETGFIENNNIMIEFAGLMVNTIGYRNCARI